MSSLLVSALLTDGEGAVLLVRRKGTALWRLPGGQVGRAAAMADVLVSLCRRQVGVAPDFVAPLFTFVFAGRQVTVGRDVIPHAQARACGWIESVQWCAPERLPVGLDPLAAVAISLRDERHLPAVKSTAIVAIGR